MLYKGPQKTHNFDNLSCKVWKPHAQVGQQWFERAGGRKRDNARAAVAQGWNALMAGFRHTRRFMALVITHSWSYIILLIRQLMKASLGCQLGFTATLGYNHS